MFLLFCPPENLYNNRITFGDVAQLVERRVSNAEVSSVRSRPSPPSPCSYKVFLDLSKS